MSRLRAGDGGNDSEKTIPVIGIFGVGHSGSTLVERCIASHPDCVGLGELDETIRQARERGMASFAACTCGVSADSCPVWGRLAEATGDDNGLILEAMERAVTASGRKVAVDSSKRKGQASRHLSLQQNGSITLVSVYLYRDVRSWAVSRKVSREDAGMGALGYIKRSWGWMRAVMHGRRALARMGIRPLLVRYEDFVRAPASVLAPVFERAGLGTDVAIDPGASCQHALKGNEMRLDPLRNSRIVVDDKWRSDWRTRWLAPFVIGPLIYNYILTKSVNGDRRGDGRA